MSVPIEEDPTDELTEELILEYVEARKRITAAEEALKEEKRKLAYYEEVIWLLGETTIRTEHGTVSVGSAAYASVTKRNFQEADRFLQKHFGKHLSEFLVPNLTATTQKRLAKLLGPFANVPECIKVYDKPTFRLRVNSHNSKP